MRYRQKKGGLIMGGIETAKALMETGKKALDIANELKNVDFKPDFIGQLQFYITAVDETLKKDADNPTIGLLLFKGKDKYSVEWYLKSTTAPIGVASYEIRNYLPTEEELIRYLK